MGDPVAEHRVGVTGIRRPRPREGRLEVVEALGRLCHQRADTQAAGRRDLGADVHDHEALHSPGVGAGEGDGHAPAHREPDERDAREPDRVDEGRQVARHRCHRVVAVGSRVRVAVTALVEDQNPVAGGERARLVVPGPGVTGDPVEQHHGGRRGGSPVQEVKLLAVQHERTVVVDARL